MLGIPLSTKTVMSVKYEMVALVKKRLLVIFLNDVGDHLGGTEVNILIN